MIASLHPDIILFDTAEVDGSLISEELVAEAQEPCKGEVIIAGRRPVFGEAEISSNRLRSLFL